MTTTATRTTIATHATYAAAEADVDYLSDQHFPVEHVSIVGKDMEWVEHVTGLLFHALQRGRRDFASISGLAPRHYEVVVDSQFADEATRLLSQRTSTRT